MKEKQPGRFIYVLLIIIAAILFLVFGICIYLALSRDDFGVINYISITSSFSVALLTVIYVYASTKQMYLMKLQLDEMKREHMLQTKPILVLDQPEFSIEAPRFFYSPPEDQFSFQSRYFFRAKLVNASDDPGIVVNISAKISIHNGQDVYNIYSFNNRFSISSSKDEPNKVHFLFYGDLNGTLFDALREHKTINIDTVIYYKNTTGACFSTSNSYLIVNNRFARWTTDKDENENRGIDIQSTIREWHTAIVQAPTKYIESIRRLKKIVYNRDKREQEEYEQLFNAVKNDFLSMYTESDNLKCNPTEINGTFELKTITNEEFEEALNNEIMLLDKKQNACN